MAASFPPHAWRLNKKPKHPNPLFFYRFNWTGEILPALWNLAWKSFLIGFCVVFIWGLLLFIPIAASIYIWIALCISIGVIGVPCAWAFFSDDWNLAEQVHSEHMKAYQEHVGLLQQKHPFPITGHEQFKQSVERVLDELQARAPHRYREAISYFDKAEYQGWQRNNFTGRSDGYFSIDGSENNYEYFRFVFLHEVGHKVEYRDDESSEEKERTADRYANMVLVEMGFPPYR